MRGVLADIGWADAVLARETPDGLMLIDGHLRAEVAPEGVEILGARAIIDCIAGLRNGGQRA